MEDDRNDREKKQEVNEKSRGVKDNESADPGKDQNQRQYEKHRNFLSLDCFHARCVEMTGDKKGLPAAKNSRRAGAKCFVPARVPHR